MPKTALVINPWVADFKLYDEWMHPVGLYLLISLFKHNGFDVYFFDCLQRPKTARNKQYNVGDIDHRVLSKPSLYKPVKRKYKLYGQSQESLEQYLSTIPNPDTICFGSGMTYWYPGLLETIQVVSERFPKVPCVIGGISAKLIPQILRSCLPNTFIFEGSIFDQNSLKNSNIPLIHDLETARWDKSLLPALQCLTHAHHGPVIASLGCPLSCTYCASRMLQKDFIPRNGMIIAQEIKYLQSRFKVKDFAFYDDALLYQPRRHFIPLMKLFQHHRISARFHTPNGMHIKWLSSDLLSVMLQSGFSTLRFGFESGDSRYRSDTNEKVSKKELEEKIALVLKNGFTDRNVGVYIMAGLVNQSPEDVQREMQFVAMQGVKVKPVFLSPIPRTQLFEHYADQYPQLRTEPLFQNDSFFVAQLPGWDFACMQQIIDISKKMNGNLEIKTETA
ncbi:MAG: B12-binding domain-containing radical SAM protein [Chitinivibrionales bacterium]